MWFFVPFCTQQKSVQRKIFTKTTEFLHKNADLCNFFTQKKILSRRFTKKKALFTNLFHVR